MHWGASGDQSGPVQVAVTVSLWNQEHSLLIHQVHPMVLTLVARW